MKRYTGRAHPGFGLLLGLGVVLLTPAQPPATAAAGPSNLVPFKIIQGTATTDRITIPANPSVQAVRASSSGQSDLFGPVTILTNHINHLGADGLPISTTDGVGVVNGANGDAFFFTYSGVIQPPSQPGVFAFEFPFNITGGTGRFAGATGSGVTSGVTDIPHKQATLTMEGMITAPGQPAAVPATPPKLVPFNFAYTSTSDRLLIPGNLPIGPTRINVTSGQADFLGPITGIGHDVSHLGADGSLAYIDGGVLALTAANGDSVFTTFVGVVRPSTTPGIVSLELPMTITGGAGRLAGATGSGVLAVSVDVSKGQSNATFVGTITAPKP